MKLETTKQTIALKADYPIIMGTSRQPSSRADATGVYQQFIDRRIQKEIVVSRSTVGQNDKGAWQFAWRMTFYAHPGMRREVPIEPKHLASLIDYVHALAVGVAPADDLDRRLGDWCAFHTLGFGGTFETSADVIAYLKRNSFAWETVAGNVAAYGIETHAARKTGEV